MFGNKTVESVLAGFTKVVADLTEIHDIRTKEAEEHKIQLDKCNLEAERCIRVLSKIDGILE